MRGVLVCNACNTEFPDEATQKSHYRSDWHQYNLKRKVAGVPGITEALFKLRLEALAADKKKSDPGESLVYKCSLCNKEYRSAKAHAQHLTSKAHIQKASSQPEVSVSEITVTRRAPSRQNTLESEQDASGKSLSKFSLKNAAGDETEGSSDEWEEVDGDTNAFMSSDDEGADKADGDDHKMEDLGEWDVTKCFFCDLIPDGTIEGCVEHMHKKHGFFIPDSEYLSDPRGLLNYLGLKVTKGMICLYCNERGRQFHSVEAVRKHMLSKSHCKLPYGEEDIEDELEDFYDFSSSYAMDGADTQIVSVDPEMASSVSLSSTGSELVLRESNKVIGCREFARYYKQRPRPSDVRDGVLVNSLVARYRSMGLATRQSSIQAITNFRQTKKLHHYQSEVMRTKLGIKNNVLKNLPKNVPY